MKKVSIITITFNNEAGLKRTIESVLAQTYTDYEYIVIDGGSKDGSLELIKQHAERIDYWVSEPDKGIYNAMNKGIVRAGGEYLHFLNAGDIYATSDVLSRIFAEERVFPLLQGTQICDYGDRQERWLNVGDKEATLYDLYKHTLLHQATLIKRELFEKYGLYDEELKVVSDWKFFFQAILGGERTQFLDFDIVIFEMFGISTNEEYLNLQRKEKKEQIVKLLPPTILPDYERLREMENDEYIVKFVKSNTFVFNSFKIFRKMCIMLGIYKTEK